MSTLTPRVVLVHRRTELDELTARHGTRQHAAWFLSQRGQDLEELQQRADADADALQVVQATVPAGWRTGRVERADLDRFLFAPEDIVVVVGQDGLVANVAKYLTGQPVIGVNPDPSRNSGVMVRHGASEVAGLLTALTSGHLAPEARTMVAASTDDGQTLLALNEIYLGQPTHQTARWSLTVPERGTERQATSGMIVATGTGATGWCRSIVHDRGVRVPLPGPTDAWLAWFVREAWPSPSTGADLTGGLLEQGHAVEVVVESDGLVAFGDGIEADRLTLSYGQVVTIGVAAQHLQLI